MQPERDAPDVGAAHVSRAEAGSSTSASTMARSSTTSQPTAMRPALGLSADGGPAARAAARPCWRPRARGRRRARGRPASRAAGRARRRAAAESRDLHERAGHRDRAHRQQVAQREMQADAEHQQDDADLGQLAGEVLIGDEARRERSDHDARRPDSRPAAACAADGRRRRRRRPARPRRRWSRSEGYREACPMMAGWPRRRKGGGTKAGRRRIAGAQKFPLPWRHGNISPLLDHLHLDRLWKAHRLKGRPLAA